jgi:hypothetical protein
MQIRGRTPFMKASGPYNNNSNNHNNIIYKSNDKPSFI